MKATKNTNGIFCGFHIPKPSMHLQITPRFSRKIHVAVRFIGSDIHNARWFSDNIGDFMQLVGPIPEGTLWLKHGMLEVYIPEPEYVLVLKLLAGRKKDLDDIQALFQQLAIEERKQARALLQRYVDKMLLDDYRAQVGRLLRKLLKA